MAMNNKQKASVAQAEREIQALKSENAQLKKELERVSSLYKQLTDEGPSENYEERRVNMLKSQVIQLERQVLIQSEALASRAAALLEVENNMQKVSAQLRELLASEVRGPSVPVERSQLTTLIESAEGARIRLYKNIEHCGTDKLLPPVMYMGNFLKPGRGEETTLLQVCSGNLEHINLKQVAKLESKLFSLHKQLQLLHQSLSTIWSADSQPTHLTHQHVALPVNQRLSWQLAKCGKSLQECCQDLLVLSILTPAAPWPVLQRSINSDINLESVISSLPSFPKSKQQQVKASVTALLKACNYSRQVAKLEAKACAEELKFHQAVYRLQIKYMESLFNAVREAYSAFEKSVQSLICQPMQEILQEFNKLKTSASEEALKDFLKSFKIHAEQLESAIESLAVVQEDGQSQGEEALSQFGHEFLSSVQSAAAQCAQKRDNLAQEIQEVKDMQEQHAKEELIIFKRKTEEEEKAAGMQSKVAEPDENQERQSEEARKEAVNGKKAEQQVSPQGSQNGVRVRPQLDKKRGTSLKSPVSGNAKQVPKVRRGSERVLTQKPPSPTSRGIPTPASRSRGGSRNTTIPAASQRSSSMSNIPTSPRGKGIPVKFPSHSSGSGIPKLSPRSGIPRACSTPSRLSQQGMDGVAKVRSSSTDGLEEETAGIGSAGGSHTGDS